MAIELVVIGLLFCLIIGAFILSLLTEQKIFLLGSFLLLMFGGILVQSAGGVIVGHYYDVDGLFQNNVITLADSVLFLFSQACFWIGLVVSAWLGLTVAFGSNRTSAGNPFNW